MPAKPPTLLGFLTAQLSIIKPPLLCPRRTGFFEYPRLTISW